MDVIYNYTKCKRVDKPSDVLSHGDVVLFPPGDDLMCLGVAVGTNSKWCHVGVVVELPTRVYMEDKNMVLETTEKYFWESTMGLSGMDDDDLMDHCRNISWEVDKSGGGGGGGGDGETEDDWMKGGLVCRNVTTEPVFRNGKCVQSFGDGVIWGGPNNKHFVDDGSKKGVVFTHLDDRLEGFDNLGVVKMVPKNKRRSGGLRRELQCMKMNALCHVFVNKCKNYEENLMTLGIPWVFDTMLLRCLPCCSIFDPNVCCKSEPTTSRSYASDESLFCSELVAKFMQDSDMFVGCIKLEHYHEYLEDCLTGGKKRPNVGRPCLCCSFYCTNSGLCVSDGCYLPCGGGDIYTRNLDADAPVYLDPQFFSPQTFTRTRFLNTVCVPSSSKFEFSPVQLYSF